MCLASQPHPHSPYHSGGGVGDPSQSVTFPSRPPVASGALRPALARSLECVSRGRLHKLCYVSPEPIFGKLPPPPPSTFFLFLSLQIFQCHPNTQLQEGDGEGVVYTSWTEQRVWRPGQDVCECFRLWKNKCDLRNRKKKKKRGKMKWKTTAGRTGTWRHGPDCRISNDLGKNVPEYSRRLLCPWQADSSCPSPPTPHQSATPDVLRTTNGCFFSRVVSICPQALKNSPGLLQT